MSDVKSKSTYRWQVRSKPCMSGTEHRSPSVSLAGWLRRWAGELTDESKITVEEQVQRLQDNEQRLLDAITAGKARSRLPKPAPQHASAPAAQASPGRIAYAVVPSVDLTIEQLEELLCANIRTERHVPIACAAAIQQLVVDLMRSNLEANPVHAALVLLLPKLLWHSNFRQGNRRPRGHQRQRLIHERLVAARQGQWQALWRDALAAAAPPPPPSAKPTAEQKAARLLRAARQHTVAQTWRQLESPGLAELNQDSWDQAAAKWRPMQAAPQTEEPAVSGGDAITAEMLKQAVLHLKPRKAFDQYGWSHEAMQLVWQSAHVPQAAADFLPQLFNSPWPEAWHPVLHAFRPVLLKKSYEGKGIRPIAISGVWRKVWAATIAAQLAKILPPLTEHVQYGTGVPNGPASFAAAIQSAIMDDAAPCVLQVDIANAFSAMDRDSLLSCLAHHAPAAYAQWQSKVHRYMQHPICVVKPNHESIAGSAFLPVYEGVAQGDPLSALLFGTCVGLILRECQQALPAFKAYCYMDDIVAVAPADMILPVFHLLEKELGHYNLQVQAAKTTLWYPEHPRGTGDDSG